MRQVYQLGIGENTFIPTVPTCAVRETASLGIMGAIRLGICCPRRSLSDSKCWNLVAKTQRYLIYKLFAVCLFVPNFVCMHRLGHLHLIINKE